MASTITLQKIVDFASTLADLMPLANVGGYTNEPSLSICNDVISSLLSEDHLWKFNSVETGILATTPNKQTYLWAGASAYTTSKGAAVGLASDNAITEVGNTVTVVTLEDHGFAVGDTVYMSGNTVAAYNDTTTGWVITAIPTTTSFTFTHASSGLAASGAAGITDFGWLEYATMVDVNDSSDPQRVYPLRAVRHIQPDSEWGVPDRISVLSQTDAGVWKVRLWPLPSNSVFAVTFSYQKKSPLKTALTQFWDPFPDEYSFVYRQAFIYHAYRFLNDRRADAEYQKLQIAIQKAMGNDDSELSDESVVPAQPLVNWFGGWA